MKKLIFFLLVCLIPFWTLAQKTNLDRLPEKERNEYLIEEAKKAVLKYGPSYYREFKQPIIQQEYVTSDKRDFAIEEKKQYINRSYYTVEYPYDENYESFNWYYAAKVHIWSDTGKAFKIIFGNGFGFSDLDKPKTKSDNEEERFMYYERIPPREKNTK